MACREQTESGTAALHAPCPAALLAPAAWVSSCSTGRLLPPDTLCAPSAPSSLQPSRRGLEQGSTSYYQFLPGLTFICWGVSAPAWGWQAYRALSG